MEAVHFRVFPSQIKRRANLYSSRKVLIAWEAKRHFCVFADGVRRNGRVRGVRYLSQPSSLFVFFTVKKIPLRFLHEAGISDKSRLHQTPGEAAHKTHELKI